LWRSRALHHRELLGALSLAAYQTVKELMAAAMEEKGLRPGMVSVVQTFGEGAKFSDPRHSSCGACEGVGAEATREAARRAREAKAARRWR
jgi:hypothetical protein